jgi:Fe2+ or Zn2+ uptake regulation protein
MKQDRLRHFRELCRERGLPFTVQRRAILEATLGLGTHPTADQVHDAVAVRHPDISRATVYRTLEQLARLGIIAKACHPGRGIRYDRRTDVHHHLVCLRCDDVVDIDDERLNALPLPDTTALGFEIKGFGVELRGLCRRCRALED